MNSDISVIKRNGTKVKFDARKIQNCARRACKGLSNVDWTLVVFNAEVKLYDGIPTTEIDKALVKSAQALIEEEPAYKFVAARILLSTIYKSAFEGDTDGDVFIHQYKAFFKKNMKDLMKDGILSPKLNNFNFKKIVEAIDPSRDLLIGYEGLNALVDRYLYKLNGRIVETPQAWMMRVAMGLALAEKEDVRDDKAIEFYHLLSQQEYMASTPTLFYSGSTRNQLSSCFLNTFEDSIDGIFDGLNQEAQKSKFAGGLGMDLTPFRAGNAYIEGTGGFTQGAVFFWKLYNDMLVAVNQGGKRRGAGCAYLETWHFDIEDFLEMRKNTGDHRRRTHDMNTANWIPDLFMEQVAVDGMWYLFSPDEVPDLHDLFGAAFKERYWEYVEMGKAGKIKLFRELKAKDLWKKMLGMLFETGHPWITFKDPSNIRYSNQHEGVVHSSNLCTEILLHTKATTYEPNNNRQILEYGETAVCNLGSINLAKHLITVEDEVYIDYNKLSNTIATAIRMLDNVIDINFYPTQEAKLSNTKHRPIGLGSMGWHDVFLAMGIDYDSDRAIELSNFLYEFISYHAILNSSILAAERGRYQTYEGSLWSKDILPIDTYIDLMKSRGEPCAERGEYETLDWSVVRDSIRENGMRNSNTMAIAPTATISRIVGCSSCTEPYYNILFARTALDGDFTVVNEWFVEDMKREGIWGHELVKQMKRVDGDVYKLDIPEKYKSKYRNAFQIDQFKLLEAASVRGRWIDQGMSVNLFNDKTSTRFLHEIYSTAWRLGLKTTYYLRTKGASQIEKASVSGEAAMATSCSIDNPECESCQ